MTTSQKHSDKDLRDPARQTIDQKPAQPNHDKNLGEEARGEKATQFDGNPNVEKADDGLFSPKDDTPWSLKKKG